MTCLLTSLHIQSENTLVFFFFSRVLFHARHSDIVTNTGWKLIFRLMTFFNCRENIYFRKTKTGNKAKIVHKYHLNKVRGCIPLLCSPLSKADPE